MAYHIPGKKCKKCDQPAFNKIQKLIGSYYLCYDHCVEYSKKAKQDHNIFDECLKCGRTSYAKMTTRLSYYFLCKKCYLEVIENN